MRRKQLDTMSCSIAKAIDVVGDPWTLLLIRDALLGVTRFEAFARRLGIPRATLTARLDHLITTGVLAAREYRSSPPRLEYVLTDKGRALAPVVVMLMRWGDEWARDDEPPTTLVDVADGHLVDPVLVDRSSGRPLGELRVRAVGPVTEGIDDREPGATL